MGISGGVLANPKTKQATISAVIIRANGRVENLGTVAYWHRNPLRRMAWSIGHWFKERNAR